MKHRVKSLKRLSNHKLPKKIFNPRYMIYYKSTSYVAGLGGTVNHVLACLC